MSHIRLLALFLTFCLIALTIAPPALAENASDNGNQEAQTEIQSPYIDKGEIEFENDFVSGLIPEEYELTYPDDAVGRLRGSSFDTRETYQTSVKDQGSNGLCWTFGSYAA